MDKYEAMSTDNLKAVREQLQLEIEERRAEAKKIGLILDQRAQMTRLEEELSVLEARKAELLEGKLPPADQSVQAQTLVMRAKALFGK